MPEDRSQLAWARVSPIAIAPTRPDSNLGSGTLRAAGREVALPEYLERVWEVVGREALEQVLGTAAAQARNGKAGALEEDARLTALFLWTMQATEEESADGAVDDDAGEEDTARRRPASHSLPFDVVRRFAQPLGIHLEDWESRIIETEKGVVRLTPVRERGRQPVAVATAMAADPVADDVTTEPQRTLFSWAESWPGSRRSCRASAGTRLRRSRSSRERSSCCSRAHAVDALYVLDGGAWVSYVVGAPDFLNRPVAALFAEGLPCHRPARPSGATKRFLSPRPGPTPA